MLYEVITLAVVSLNPLLKIPKLRSAILKALAEKMAPTLSNIVFRSRIILINRAEPTALANTIGIAITRTRAQASLNGDFISRRIIICSASAAKVATKATTGLKTCSDLLLSSK